jgi:transcriptional repressor NrdR
MKCPECKGKTEVFDSRWKEGNVVRRRRQCRSCSHRFTTNEILEHPAPRPVKSNVIKMKPKKQRINYNNIDDMTDEELESAIFSGDFNYD